MALCTRTLQSSGSAGIPIDGLLFLYEKEESWLVDLPWTVTKGELRKSHSFEFHDAGLLLENGQDYRPRPFRLHQARGPLRRAGEAAQKIELFL